MVTRDATHVFYRKGGPIEVMFEILTDLEINALLLGAGRHAGRSGDTPPPFDNDTRLLYALAEVIDFDCHKCGDIERPSLEETKRFLIMFKDEVPLTTFLGFLSGKFDFLQEA